MDKKLQEINRQARNTCRIPLKIGDIWQSGGCLQVFFSSTGCRFRDAGYCTMCDYGGFRNLSAEEAVQMLEQAIADREASIQEILLGTCGSILDDLEMPWFVLRAILNRVNETSIPKVILETHYKMVPLSRPRKGKNA